MTFALMNDPKRDSTHSHAALLCLTAEIEVVEMKIEPLVELNSMFFEGEFFDGKKDTIHELAFLPSRTIDRQLTWKGSAMTNK